MLSRVRICSIALTISAVACGVSIKSGVNTSTETSSCTPAVASSSIAPAKTASACSELVTQNECVADKRCMAITGARVLKHNDCVGPEEFVTCEVSRTCRPEFMHAFDLSQRMWRFLSTCIPEGWLKNEYVDEFAVRECGQPSPCPKLSKTECIQNVLCMPMNGSRIDFSRGCMEYREFVACRDRGWCGTIISCVADPSGHLWQFGSTCFPPDWLRHVGSACRPYEKFCEPGS